MVTPVKMEAALLRSPNTEQCCEPSCKLFSCPMGLLKKPSFIKTDGFATEACCDATCTACPKTRGWTFQCKKGFLLREDAGSVVAGSAQLAPERCCRPTCAGFLAHSASSFQMRREPSARPKTFTANQRHARRSHVREVTIPLPARRR